MDGFSGNSVWGLVLQGDIVTKFVLLLLLFMSVLCWAIALYKIVLFRIKQQQFNQVSIALKDKKDFMNLFAVTSEHAKTMPGYFLSRCLKYLKELLILKKSGEKEYAQSSGIEFMQMQIDQTIEEVVHQEESYLPILSVSAASAPLLGLFGTVWGLVHSFISISEKQSADIVTVAPGIAEALITTLAGLVVAVPALFLFYFLNTKVREIEQKLLILSESVITIARQLALEKEGTSESIVDNNFLMSDSKVDQD